MEKGRDWNVKGLGEEVGARKGKRLYRLLFHGPLRFVTSHSRFTLTSRRNRTRLRRKQGRQAVDSFDLSCQVDCSLHGSLAPRIGFPSPIERLQD